MLCQSCLPQGVRGSYELTKPGVLLPASLSPLAHAPQPLPPFNASLASIEAQLAAQGLTGSASMLAAVAAAWQVGMGAVGVGAERFCFYRITAAPAPGSPARLPSTSAPASLAIPCHTCPEELTCSHGCERCG